MFTKSIQQVRKSIFPIFFFGNNGTHGSLGTGFFIDDQGHFLTANHVVEALPPGGHLAYLGNIPNSSFQSKKPSPMQLLAQDKRNDLALGRIDHERLTPLEFADNEALVGQSIALCGYPLPNISAQKVTNNENLVGMKLDVSQVRQYWQPTMKMDKIKKNTFFNKPFDSLITQHPSLPGMSGGPIFDLEGKVVGVNTANATRQIHRKTLPLQVENGIGIELSEVKAFVNKVLKKAEVI